MKKIVQNMLLVLICFTALVSFCYISLTFVGGGDLKAPFVGGTTAAITSQTTTEVIATTQKVTTTRPATTTTTAITTTATTQPSTAVEVENFTIIDYFPLSLASGGSWDIKHCQGMAIDQNKDFAYYSYTNTFVKCDLEGNAVGSITGIEGHLGDICYNEKDGKVYASLNPEGKKALYLAIIDVDNLNELGVDAVKGNLIRTVHLTHVWKDYSARVKNQGKTYYRRYGVSGTDAMCFGPSFETGKGHYLTISCGTTPQTERTDNDYQVLVQYDVTGWWAKYGQPLSYNKVHHIGPDDIHGKFFVYTGNTNYGVQTMTYFDELNLWFLNVYSTLKEDFPKYNLFIVDADVKPEEKALKGQEKKDVQKVLTLYKDGSYDENTKIYGWNIPNGAKGMEYLFNGLFYIIHPYKTWYGKQTGVAYLYVWNPSATTPFTIAAGVDDDYTIVKKVPKQTKEKTG